MRLHRKKVVGILTILCTVAGSLYIASIPNATFLKYVGTENVYFFMYAIALIGSISTFASIPYPLILISIVSAGADPLYAGLASALGAITADTSTFFAARRGSVLLSTKIHNSLHHLGEIAEKHPRFITPLLLIYGTFSPLSNDFAVITFSLMEYSYTRVILPLAFGNITYNITLAYYGNSFVALIKSLFS